MPQPDAEQESGAPPPQEVLDAAQELLDNVELIDVRAVSMSAELADGVAPGEHVTAVGIDVALSFAADEGVYGSRFDFRFELRSDDESLLGEIEFALVIDYSVREGFTPDIDAADFVTSTTGFFAAFPYARELFQSLATRLQFDPVVLGMIKRGSMRPGSVTVAPHRSLSHDGEAE